MMLLFLFALISQAIIGASTLCSFDANNIEVVKDFEINKFKGKWYETKWYVWYDKTESRKPEHIVDGAVFYFEFKEGDDKALWFEFVGYPRFPADSKCVVYGKNKRKIYSANNDKTGNLTYGDAKGDRDHYWVLDTDYTNYALVARCGMKDLTSDGQCNPALSVYVLSREKSLPPQIEVRFNEIITNKLCLDLNKMIITDLNRECPRTSSAGRIHVLPTTTILLSSLLVILNGIKWKSTP